jgi:anion-transporting  ArsA/GET3 family ATPase
MDVAAFCAESRVLIVAGKGGVGKTTIAAALARMAARSGLSVLLVELEGKAGLAAAYGAPGSLDYEESVLLQEGDPSGEADGDEAPPTVRLEDLEPPAPGHVRARRLTPDDALLEYLRDHGLQRVSRRLVSSGVVDVVATAIPGLRDVLVLGKIKQLERNGVADLIVVDAPATGHAITFLTSAAGLLDAARGGPVRVQAAEVVDMLHDPSRCRVVLVTLPEEMPVSETIESAYLLEDRAGVQLGPVVVNGVDVLEDGMGVDAAEAARAAGLSLSPAALAALESAREFRLRRHGVQAEQTARLGRELPLPQLRTPELHSESIGSAELDTLARALAESVGSLEAETPAA